MSLTMVSGRKSWKAFSVFIFSWSSSCTFSITSFANTWEFVKVWNLFSHLSHFEEKNIYQGTLPVSQWGRSLRRSRKGGWSGWKCWKALSNESQIVVYPNNIIIPETNYRPYYSNSKASCWISIAWIYSDWAYVSRKKRKKTFTEADPGCVQWIVMVAAPNEGENCDARDLFRVSSIQLLLCHSPGQRLFCIFPTLCLSLSKKAVLRSF